MKYLYKNQMVSANSEWEARADGMSYGILSEPLEWLVNGMSDLEEQVDCCWSVFCCEGVEISSSTDRSIATVLLAI